MAGLPAPQYRLCTEENIKNAKRIPKVATPSANLLCLKEGQPKMTKIHISPYLLLTKKLSYRYTIKIS